MSFYIAVLFFCVNESCIFYKEDQIFQDERSCYSVVTARVKELSDKNISSHGVCMEMMMGKPA
jgi:hypothetical protein